MHTALLFVGGIVLLLLIGLLALYVGDVISRRRLRSFARAGKALGLSRVSRQSTWPEETGRDIALRRRAGSFTDIRNVLRGQAKKRYFLVFDFRYAIADTGPQGLGPRAGARGVYDQTVVLLRIEGASLPRFELRSTDHMHAKTGRFQDWRDITLPEELPLDSGYLLRGEQEPDVLDLLRAGLAEYIHANEDLCVDAGGEWVAVYRQSDLIEPKRLEAFVEDAMRVVEILMESRGLATSPVEAATDS